MSSFQHRDPGVNLQAIATASATQQHKLGEIRQAWDATLGAGEFIYLKGVANTAVGSVVTYNSQTFATTLAAVGNKISFPVAIAMSACVANDFGWYQISGVAVALKTCTVSIPVGSVGVLTTGLIAKTASGKEVLGALCTAISSNKAGNTTATLLINRPDFMGRIT